MGPSQRADKATTTIHGTPTAMRALQALAEQTTYCECQLPVNRPLHPHSVAWLTTRRTRAMRLSKLVGLTATLFLATCGGAGGPGGQPLSVEKRASTPPSGPGDAPILTMVIRPGYDPTQLGRRIAGRSATVQLAPQTPQENMPVGILRTTYRVTLQPGHGCEALTRASREPGVRRAYLGAYPGQYPDC